MHPNLNKSQYIISGEQGLPESYPVPKDIQSMLFYIQRNLNMNTVVYTVNKDNYGIVDDFLPINVFWMKYSEGGDSAQLNQIQKRAFGYTASKINNDAYEIRMKSYDKLGLFLNRNDQGSWKITTKINSKNAYLSNIYVFADEFGIFPQVKYIELYGITTDGSFPIYQRIPVES